MKFQRLSALLCCIMTVFAHGNLIRGRSFFSPRPQGFSGPITMLHQLDYFKECSRSENDECKDCAQFSATAVYQRAYDQEERAQYFFGTDRLVFAGSRVIGRDDSALLADYWGLATDFESTVLFKPEMRHAIINFEYAKYSQMWGKEWFFQVDLPVVWASYDLGLRECCCETPGELDYPAGYMATTRIKRDVMPENVTEAWKGEHSFGDLQPLRYGRIKCAQNDVDLADVNVSLGVCTVSHDDHYFALHARMVAPTGTRPRSCFLFEPVIGNGRHWELGLGMSGYARLWESEDGASSWNLYGEGTASHLFKSRQKRSFDFKLNAPMSRYILIEELGTPIVQGLQVPTGQDTEAQYHGKIMPAINQTTLDAVVSVPIQADITIKFAYQSNDRWSIEFGGNLWARTEETLKSRQCFPEKSFAIKGDAQLYGFQSLDGQFVALNATQKAATIYFGQGDGNANNQLRNLNADDAMEAVFRGGTLVQTLPESTDAGAGNTGIIATDTVSGSAEPVFITDCDIDNLSALAPAALAYKLFVSTYYTWHSDEPVRPYIGLGGQVEFDGTSKRYRAAASMWAVWFEGGIAY